MEFEVSFDFDFDFDFEVAVAGLVASLGTCESGLQVFVPIEDTPVCDSIWPFFSLNEANVRTRATYEKTGHSIGHFSILNIWNSLKIFIFWY